MTHTFIRGVAAVIIIFIVTSCFWDKPDPKPVYDPQTIEEVITQREYYFTCYMNGELWYTEHYSGWYNFELEMYAFNIPPYDNDSSSGSIYISTCKQPNPNDNIEKNYLSDQRFYINIDSQELCEFGYIDTIPYELSLNYNSNSCISFSNGFYTQTFIDLNGIGTISNYTNYNIVSDFHFWIDSVISNNDNVFWGRFEGNFANANGDTLLITDGVYKINAGEWNYSSMHSSLNN